MPVLKEKTMNRKPGRKSIDQLKKPPEAMLFLLDDFPKLDKTYLYSFGQQYDEKQREIREEIYYIIAVLKKKNVRTTFSYNINALCTPEKTVSLSWEDRSRKKNEDSKDNRRVFFDIIVTVEETIIIPSKVNSATNIVTTDNVYTRVPLVYAEPQLLEACYAHLQPFLKALQQSHIEYMRAFNTIGG
jgi:hypothetical protein